VVLVKAPANQAHRTSESGLRVFLATDGSECSITAAHYGEAKDKYERLSRKLEVPEY
jgi:hypothetical protein